MIFFFPSLCTEAYFAEGARIYSFFDSVPSTPQLDQAKKYPSIIIVRQTEITLLVLLGERGKLVVSVRHLCLYLSFAFNGSMCKYSLNSVIAIFIETKCKKKSLRVIASHRGAFYNYGIIFLHDKLSTRNFKVIQLHSDEKGKFDHLFFFNPCHDSVTLTGLVS